MSKEELFDGISDRLFPNRDNWGGYAGDISKLMVAAYNKGIEDAVKASKDCYWLVDSTEARSECLRVEEKLYQLKIKD